MLFKNYRKFQKTLKLDYDPLFKSYPYSRLVLDYVSQLWIDKRKSDSWVDEIDFIKVVENNTSKGLTAFIYRTFLQIGSYFIKYTRPKNGIHLSVLNDRFPGLEECCKEVAILSGRRLYLQGKFFKFFIDYLIFNRLSPYRFIVGSRTAKLLRKFLVPNEDSFKNLLSDNKLMYLLEESVKNDVERTRKLFDRLGISIFLNTGDSSPSARILIAALKNNGSKVISFAHGYIVADNLISIAPIQSDYLIVWTKMQQEEIRNALSFKCRKKVVYIGFPKFFKNCKTYEQNKNVLLVFSQLNNILTNSKTFQYINNLIKLLTIEKYKVTIRLHPNEKNRFPIIEKFIKNSKVFLSNNSLQDDFVNTSIVIGAHTSVLVEAASSGIPSFELKEFCTTKSRLEMVNNITFKNLEILIKSNNFSSYKTSNISNKRKFINKLTELVIN